MSATVEVEEREGKTYTVSITSECEMLAKLGTQLTELTMMDAFKRHTDNPVYVKAATCLRHVACPVPSGILKALEVEAGLNVARDVVMIFLSAEQAQRDKSGE